MRKLFISYRSSDAAKVDKIALDLSFLQNDDGTARYSTWQDKHNLPPASPNWWDAIVNAIGDSDIFVFNISKASLQSEVCRAELDYAHKLNLPIIPLVLEGEFFLDPKSGKYNIAYWDLIPEWLAERQLLFYLGAEFFKDFENAVAMFERSWPRRLTAKPPLNPDSKSVHGSNHAVYDAACDYADRLAFADAERHFDALVRRNDEDYVDWAAQWLEIIRLYGELIEIDSRPNARFMFKKKWEAYTLLFPKEFLDGVFDPKQLDKRYMRGLKPPSSNLGVFGKISNLRPRIGVHVIQPYISPTLSLMPQPFAWINIPNKGYSITKYPITNAQFAEFIEAGGYDNPLWWTEDGWKAKLKGWSWDTNQLIFKETKNAWTVPRNWTNGVWKTGDQPVTNVSWHEAIAFCRWLSEEADEEIMLPTADQWLYAAQGDDGRTYPWGNDWSCDRCNNSVSPCRSNTTMSVTQYEGISDSPFGVVEMVGNVSEMCLTDFNNKTNDISSNVEYRALRGGSFMDTNIDKFRCDYRIGIHTHYNYGNCGFRIVRS